MKKFIPTMVLACIFTQTFAQTQKKFSAYLQTQFNLTLYDRTTGNNPWGVGLGSQFFLNTETKFKPTLELTADTYFASDDVAIVNPDGKIADEVGNMFNLFGGASFYPSQKISLSILAGPSFINSETLFGIKPSFALYSNQQKWMGRISFINIFNRYKNTKKDFGTISFSIARKIF